jgi:hypothetical protein
MSNLLNDYHQSVVSRTDWMPLFRIYTRTQRKDGRPYIAEAANPDDGSWAGHDTPQHSEHYFHSAYVDLVITGAVGLRPRADDSVVVNPLAPADWPFFALDDVLYHGRRLTIIWDRDGSRYGRGSGLTIIADGRTLAHAPRLGRLAAYLGPAPSRPRRSPRPVNLAVNNDKATYPRVEVSYAAPGTLAANLVDGNYWYHVTPANRWTTTGSPNARDTVTIDFGAPRRVDRVKLYILDDGLRTTVRAPARYELQSWQRDRWRTVPGQMRLPVAPEGHRANVVSFPPLVTPRLRLVLAPRPGASVGLSELEVWGAPPTS